MSDIFDVMNLSSDVVEVVEEDFRPTAVYSPFDFIHSINSHKNLFNGPHDVNQVEKEYNPWIVNRGLSLFQDTATLANFVNQNYHLDKKLQYDFLLNTVRPKFRKSKWPKKEKDADLDIIKEAFGYSDRKAEVALSLLSPEQVKNIKKSLKKGGTK